MGKCQPTSQASKHIRIIISLAEIGDKLAENNTALRAYKTS